MDDNLWLQEQLNALSRDFPAKPKTGNEKPTIKWGLTKKGNWCAKVGNEWYQVGQSRVNVWILYKNAFINKHKCKTIEDAKRWVETKITNEHNDN
jgi:hypothetical protein